MSNETYTFVYKLFWRQWKKYAIDTVHYRGDKNMVSHCEIYLLNTANEHSQ